MATQDSRMTQILSAAQRSINSLPPNSTHQETKAQATFSHFRRDSPPVIAGDRAAGVLDPGFCSGIIGELHIMMTPRRARRPEHA